MNNSRMLLINVVVFLLLIGGGFVAYYYYNQSYYYVSTDNARIDGQLITIAAPASGKISGWTANVGSKLSAGQSLGSIQPAGGTPLSGTASATPSATNAANMATAAPGAAAVSPMPVTIPVDGTVVQQSVVPNSLVAAGTPLAYAYNMDNLFVSANINETNFNNLQPNQAVDLYVDAFPGTTLAGKISQIGLTTAAQFSLLPQQNTTANFTKVTQVVPVVISLEGYKGLNLIPGMSVTVRIHIR